jgi:hypothetical protein
MVVRSVMTRDLRDVTTRFEHTGHQINTSNVVPCGVVSAQM